METVSPNRDVRNTQSDEHLDTIPQKDRVFLWDRDKLGKITGICCSVSFSILVAGAVLWATTAKKTAGIVLTLIGIGATCSSIGTLCTGEAMENEFSKEKRLWKKSPAVQQQSSEEKQTNDQTRPHSD